ncbi:MAG TPA: MFS transporter [Bryobacteraceae bacterium]|nr:MFS transporter [Bryobacteraceae bacterium]
MAPTVSTPSDFEAATYRRVTRRLMPYLFFCYILAYLGRVNVSFAKLQMQQDLRISDSVYGLGAGIFFIGYFFFEVPGNLIMQRVGARYWIGPIMMIWGVVSASTMLARGATSFYALRFLLGVVESGFFPGVILYLTLWYPSRYRGRMVAVFMSAAAISGVVAGPISGWILAGMGGAGHLAGWQWMFLIEGLPAVLVGLITLFFLTDSPATATWLDADEKALLVEQLREDDESKKAGAGANRRFSDAFRSIAVWLLAVVYFGLAAGNYGISFWLPQLIKDDITRDPLAIGWITAIPWAAAAVLMIAVGRHSDTTGERRWHFALSLFVVAAGFAASAAPGIPGVVRLAALSLAAIGIMAGFAVFWTLPTSILSGTAAAAGIAWINSVGNLGGYVSPYVMGMMRDWKHTMTPGLLALAAMSLLAGLIALRVARRRSD